MSNVQSRGCWQADILQDKPKKQQEQHLKMQLVVKQTQLGKHLAVGVFHIQTRACVVTYLILCIYIYILAIYRFHIIF